MLEITVISETQITTESRTVSRPLDTKTTADTGEDAGRLGSLDAAGED